MSTEKSRALVIRQADFSESSRVVTLFTRSFGKIAALAKGAKRLKSPFEAALDLLSQSEIVFLRKSASSLDILTEAKLVQRFRPRPGHLGSLYGGYYVAELLDALSEPYDAHPTLFDEACRTLDSLSESGVFSLPVLRFEIIILREIGQLPAFESCVSCGAPFGPQRQFTYKVTQGGLICRNCLIEESPRYWITPSSAQLLARVATDSTAACQQLAIGPVQWKELRQIVDSTIAHTLGRRPKTLRYLQFH